jgi:hypothetical protein
MVPTEFAPPSMLITTCSNALDALSEAPDPSSALRRIETLCRVVAGPGIFSIQMNVTTAADPANEVLLQRFYSSKEAEWPVTGRKRKTHTRWTDTLFVRGEVCITEGSEALARAFDDYEQMRPLGLNAAINVPIMKAKTCYATFNVFGTTRVWQPHQILGVRMLALAATRWLTPVENLSYSFDRSGTTPIVE